MRDGISAAVMYSPPHLWLDPRELTLPPPLAPNKKKQGQTMSLGDFMNDSCKTLLPCTASRRRLVGDPRRSAGPVVTNT